LKHIMCLREGELCIRSYKDIMLGVSTAQLSKELPRDLKILICKMSTGYKVYCMGAREAEIDKNGNLNQRDMKCLGLKYALKPPQENNWTCWPCLDFLKKFKPKVCMARKTIELFHLSPVEKQRIKKPSDQAMRYPKTAVRKKEPQLSEDGKNVVVIHLSFGTVKLTQS